MLREFPKVRESFLPKELGLFRNNARRAIRTNSYRRDCDGNMGRHCPGWRVEQDHGRIYFCPAIIKSEYFHNKESFRRVW